MKREMKGKARVDLKANRCASNFFFSKTNDFGNVAKNVGKNVEN